MRKERAARDIPVTPASGPASEHTWCACPQAGTPPAGVPGASAHAPPKNGAPKHVLRSNICLNNDVMVLIWVCFLRNGLRVLSVQRDPNCLKPWRVCSDLEDEGEGGFGGRLACALPRRVGHWDPRARYRACPWRAHPLPAHWLSPAPPAGLADTTATVDAAVRILHPTSPGPDAPPTLHLLRCIVFPTPPPGRKHPIACPGANGPPPVGLACTAVCRLTCVLGQN